MIILKICLYIMIIITAAFLLKSIIDIVIIAIGGKEDGSK